MKIFGRILAIIYAILMIFAILKAKSKTVSSLFIVVGCFLILIYSIRGIVWYKSPITMLIIGMINVSIGTFLNGMKQNNIHISHHIIRLVIESIITIICWIGK